jgi:RNA polymerase sigma-70 factor, ECF subfamily
VLLLREALQLPASDVAELLEASVASVNSSLQRARATLQAAGTSTEAVREPEDASAKGVVERYLAAFEAADVSALTGLLADDVVMEMPPVDLWLVGAPRYQEFMERVFTMRGRDWHLELTQANGSTALAAYVRGTADGVPQAHSIQVFDVGAGLINRCVSFVDPAVFDSFGLPRSLA